MRIVLSDGQDVTEIFKESITILNNMRRWQKEWEREYGSELKAKKKSWEKKADAFLEKISASDKMITYEKINIETDKL